MKKLGIHNLIEIYGCDHDRIDTVDKVRDFMIMAAKESGATVVGDMFHQFNPYGISGAVIIAESHLTIHSWPEYGYAAVDVFTCGDTIDHEKLQRSLVDFFQAESYSVNSVSRGIPLHIFDKLPQPDPLTTIANPVPIMAVSAEIDHFIL